MSHREQDARHQPACPVCRPLAERVAELPSREVTHRQGWAGVDAPRPVPDRGENLLRETAEAVHEWDAAQEKPWENVRVPDLPADVRERNRLSNEAALQNFRGRILMVDEVEENPDGGYTFRLKSTATAEAFLYRCLMCGAQFYDADEIVAARKYHDHSCAVVERLQAENAELRRRVESAERSAATLTESMTAVCSHHAQRDADAELGAAVRQMPNGHVLCKNTDASWLYQTYEGGYSGVSAQDALTMKCREDRESD